MLTVKDLENQLTTSTAKSAGQALAGACAGACALSLLFPLDTVKTRKTTRSGRIYTYSGMISDLIHLRNIPDLYRGYRIGLIEVILFQGVHFFFYSLLKNDWIKKNVPNYKELDTLPPIPPLQSVARGCLAGLLTQLITTPFGVIKARLQTSNTNETVFDVIKSIYEEDGISGFWRGMKTSVLLIINPVIVFFVFERLQAFLRQRFGKTFWVDFVTGGTSKSIAAIICQPLTFIKTNLQAAQKSKSKISEFRPRTSTVPLKQPGFHNSNNSISNNNNNNSNNGVISNHMNEEETERKEDGNNRVSFNDEPDIIPAPLNRNDPLERTASMSALLNYTLKNEGIGGLYQGLGPKLLHAALMYAFIFSMKEKMTYWTFFALILITQKKHPKNLIKNNKKLVKVAN